MSEFEKLKSERVFYYFGEICKIPHGSGNMERIADFCEEFAKKHELEYVRDNADNVIIYKQGSNGYEKSRSVILQGHLDMVCQKTDESDTDFEKDGIRAYVDGGYIKADKTTLGADNGIAVAIILAILESDEYVHPPIEAVFTTDEEVGMLGALALDMSLLNSKKMINLDSEDRSITVSCAGGGDINVKMPIKRIEKQGTAVTVTLKGLQGGHSGMEINSGRVNADVLCGRILDSIKCDFDIIDINGGDKSNAIPNSCRITLCTENETELAAEINKNIEIIKKETAAREKGMEIEVVVGERAVYSVFEKQLREKLILTLLCLPNGVVEMSAEIEGLVETSLNLGILKTTEEAVEICYSLRSNKGTARDYLERRLTAFFDKMGIEYETSGYYPPWEFKANSELQKIYSAVYEKYYGEQPEVIALHAGLECGVFSSAIDGLDCISVGPEMFDVHTTDEKLGISSTRQLFNILLDTLKQMK